MMMMTDDDINDNVNYYMHIHRHSGPHRHNFANAEGLQKLEVRIHGPPTY